MTSFNFWELAIDRVTVALKEAVPWYCSNIWVILALTSGIKFKNNYKEDLIQGRQEDFFHFHDFSDMRLH